MSSFFGKLKSGTVSQPKIDSTTQGLLSNLYFILLSTSEEVLLLVYCLTRAQQGSTSPSIGSSPSKKDTTSQPQTPLEKLLLNAGPIREDGSDKFFGMENV
jgi:hypothetical protein